VVGAVIMPAQIFVGDVIAREVFHNEPAKFAGLEILPRTGDHVPETLLGVLGSDGRVRYGLRIPNGASLLAGFSPSTRIKGLDAIPADVRPRPELANTVHLSFDVMVGSAFLLLGLGLWFALGWWRRRDLPRSRLFLFCASVAGLVAVVCLETGWVVTEVGRQPWTVVGFLLTRDAVNTHGDLWLFYAGTMAIYAVVGAATILILRVMHRRWRALEGGELGVPYGPEPAGEPGAQGRPGGPAIGEARRR
jgi:cytochrome d ubiquinol oxidase subunit I